MEKETVATSTMYSADQEYIANKYVMKCFDVTMMVYALTFVLNLLGVFVIKQELMFKAFVPSLIIYGFDSTCPKYFIRSSLKPYATYPFKKICG